MIFDYIATTALALSFVLQVALDRGPDLTEVLESRSARRVLIVGIGLILAYMLHKCYLGESSHPVPLLGLLLVSLGEIGFCVNALFPKALGGQHGHRQSTDERCTATPR